MADMAKKIMTLDIQKYYDGKIKEHIEVQRGKTYNESTQYTDDRIDDLANGQVKTNASAIGTLGDLETTAKGDLVKAINEVRNSISAGGIDAAVTIEENNSPATEGVLKSYTIKQGVNTVGTINIPKDMVVQSGDIVVDPDGQAAGTYIKLVLANATNDEIYINVGTLVDIYIAQADATQIQLNIDSSTREISATIIAGSVTATELATDAVTTVKIADGNVTKAKLSAEVQESLNKADSATTDAQTKADKALEDAKAYSDQKTTQVAKMVVDLSEAVSTKLGSIPDDTTVAEMIEDATYDDSDLASRVTEVEKKVETGFVEVTKEEIDFMFNPPM